MSFSCTNRWKHVAQVHSLRANIVPDMLCQRNRAFQRIIAGAPQDHISF
jgi:hypothetical protein